MLRSTSSDGFGPRVKVLALGLAAAGLIAGPHLRASQDPPAAAKPEDAAEILKDYPFVAAGLKIACAAYVFWLAVKIARSSPSASAAADKPKRPITFLQASLFQLVNPKAWAITMPAIASFTVPGRPLALQLGVIVAAFVLVGLPSIATWAAMGAGARELLESRKGMIVFVRVMAVLTALTALLFLI